MRRIIFGLLMLWAALFGACQATARPGQGGNGCSTPGLNISTTFCSGGGGNQITLDGAPQLAGSAATGGSVTLPTVKAGDLVIMSFQTAAGGGGTFVTCCTASGLTFTQFGTVTNNESIFYAVASAPATNLVVSWTTSNIAAALGFVLTGANTSSPFDGVTYQQSSGSAVSITPTNANDFLFAWVDDNLTSTDSGFTPMGNVGFIAGEYQILNATNSFSLDFGISPTSQHFSAVGIKSQ